MGENDKNENLLRGLADFISEGHSHSGEEERLDDEIKATGIDPKGYLSRFSTLVDGVVVKRRQTMHVDRVNAGAKIAAAIMNVKERLARMTQADQNAFVSKLEPRLAGTYFRNFKSASPADKASMIEDLELLEKLDELMKEDGK